jgi:hypothetical protein
VLFSYTFLRFSYTFPRFSYTFLRFKTQRKGEEKEKKSEEKPEKRKAPLLRINLFKGFGDFFIRPLLVLLFYWVLVLHSGSSRGTPLLQARFGIMRFVVECPVPSAESMAYG